MVGLLAGMRNLFSSDCSLGRVSQERGNRLDIFVEINVFRNIEGTARHASIQMCRISVVSTSTSARGIWKTL